MSEEGTKIVGEGEGSSLNPQSHAEAVEAKAREKGWRPLEEWEGDPADWISDKEFVGRQPLYDRISDMKSAMKKQSQEFQSEMKQVAKSLSQIREIEYKKAIAELTAKRDQALEDDDAKVAVKVTEQIKELEVEKAQEVTAAKQASTTATPEFLEWQDANPWFNSDAEMQSDAINIGVGYAAGNPNKTQAEVLTYVTKKIKSMHSDKFETSKKKVVAQVEGNSPSAKQTEVNTRKGKLSFADLPTPHQVIAKTLIKQGVFDAAAKKNGRTAEAEYLAQYQENA